LDQPAIISAKTLGQLALPGYCPRCFWLSMNADRLPFQIFPGIFSAIDSYGKNVVHGWFDRHGKPPAWLAPLGEIRTYKDPPHYSKFGVLDQKNEIILRGTPDGILIMQDGSYTIIDYKTAKFTAYQDDLFPMYEAQLNAYAYIGERLDVKPVSKLALVYTEPVTGNAAAADDSNVTPEGFRMGFRARILEVEIQPDLVTRLLKTAADLLHLTSPPPGVDACKDCAAIASLLRLAGS
jgi:PD-(D/E)XK nuclease superfamily